MEIIETGINGLLEFRPKIFGDKRGYFFESYREDVMKEVLGEDINFVQDNQSFSTKGVLRGLHFQKGIHAQGKLVRVTKGKVLDVAVDLRPDSTTFGEWRSLILDTEMHNLFFVPAGFAHGFYTIEDAVFNYKCTNYYNKAAEGGILWDDPKIGIDWQLDFPAIVSSKDEELPLFETILKDLKSEKNIY